MADNPTYHDGMRQLQDLRETRRLADYGISIAAVAGLWLNVGGLPFQPSVGPYAVALTWALSVFGFIFVRTIELFLHRTPET